MSDIVKVHFEDINVDFGKLIDTAGVGFDVDRGLNASLAVEETTKGHQWITPTGATYTKIGVHKNRKWKIAIYVYRGPMSLLFNEPCVPAFNMKYIHLIESKFGKVSGCGKPISSTISEYYDEKEKYYHRARTMYDLCQFPTIKHPNNKLTKEEVIDALVDVLCGKVATI